MKPAVLRSLVAYDLKTERVHHEQELVDLDVAAAGRLLGSPAEDPELYDVYRVQVAEAGFFSSWLPSSYLFDFDLFDYFLETRQEA
jgi:hypothetical protein